MAVDLEKIKADKSIEELLEFCIVNVDKPGGITSFSAANRLRKMLKAKKAGHFGTLDPMVTGVLPVALNRATRMTTFFMKRDKVYEGLMRLHRDGIGDERLRAEMRKFERRIYQLPPVRSRVKRQLRGRDVRRFEMLGRRGSDVEFVADVEAGTYIRKLVHDLGEGMGGAHMIGLRRTRAGIFTERGCFTLEEINEAWREYRDGGREERLREMLIPAEIIGEILPVVQIRQECLSYKLCGLGVLEWDIVGELPKEGGLFAVFCGDRFVEVAERAQANEEGVVLKAKFVLN